MFVPSLGVPVAVLIAPRHAQTLLGASLRNDILAAVQTPHSLSVFEGGDHNPRWQINLESQIQDSGAKSITGVTAMSARDALVELDQGKTFLRVDQDGKVLASIKFETPDAPQYPPTIRLAAARWDDENRIVWIAHFLRGSLIGFATSRYASGVEPSFARVVEIPLETLGDAIIKSSAGKTRGSVEVFYKFPRGFSQVSVERKLVDELVADRGSEVDAPSEPVQAPIEASPQVAGGQQPVEVVHAEPETVQQEQSLNKEVPREGQSTVGKVLEAPGPSKAPATSAPPAPESPAQAAKEMSVTLEDVTAAIKKVSLATACPMMLCQTDGLVRARTASWTRLTRACRRN